MRILIVDDNVALQEVMAEVIADAGHETEVAASVREAYSLMNPFNPDVILLDADTENGSGLMLVDIMQDSETSADRKIVVLRSWNRQIPRDNSLIAGLIQKPFTTEDLLNGIDAALSDEERNDRPNKKPAEANAQTKITPADRGLIFGESYSMFQTNPSKLYEAVYAFDKDGCDVLLVTPNKSKTVRERFKNNKIESYHMTLRLIGGHLNIYKAGTMIDDVFEFIKNKERPVVAFDNVNKLIERNGMNSILTAIHLIISTEYNKKVTFLISVDPAGFTRKDREILSNRTNIYDPSEN